MPEFYGDIAVSDLIESLFTAPVKTYYQSHLRKLAVEFMRRSQAALSS